MAAEEGGAAESSLWSSVSIVRGICNGRAVATVFSFCSGLAWWLKNAYLHARLRVGLKVLVCCSDRLDRGGWRFCLPLPAVNERVIKNVNFIREYQCHYCSAKAS